MKLFKCNLFLLLCFIGIQKSGAQVFYDCVDTSRINPYYVCGDPTYQPVCGCDGVTYRNNCASYFIGGVNYTTNGTCGNFGFDILENPVATNLTISIYTKESEPVTVQAWSDMGNFIYQFNYNGFENSVQQYFIDTSEWQRGVFIITVIVRGEKQSKKVVVEKGP